MNELEQQIKELVLNKDISAIKVFNVSDNYIELEPDFQWIVDGGIQLEFGDEKLCIGWSSELGGFDFSMTHSIEQLLGDAPFYQIGPDEVRGVSDFIGSRIKEIRFKWEFYHEIDEEGEPKEEKDYTPVELFLEFDFNSFLQISQIVFEIDRKDFKIARAEYNIFGRLLLSANKKVEIEEN